MDVERQRIDYSDLDLWDELDVQLYGRPASGPRELDQDDDDGRPVGCADLFVVEDDDQDD